MKHQKENNLLKSTAKYMRRSFLSACWSSDSFKHTSSSMAAYAYKPTNTGCCNGCDSTLPLEAFGYKEKGFFYVLITCPLWPLHTGSRRFSFGSAAVLVRHSRALGHSLQPGAAALSLPLVPGGEGRLGSPPCL